jgi:phosphoglycolate phosphatase
MLRQLVMQSGIDEEILKTEMQQVFQQHGTSEYAFVIEELPSLKALHRGKNLTEVYHSAIQAYEEAGKNASRLYPGVFETLTQLKDQGCRVVGYTESMALYTIRRVKQFKLDGILDYLYSPASHDLPVGLSPEQVKHFSSDLYKLNYTVHQHTPKGRLKPSPDVLLKIIKDVKAPIEKTIYIGDSLMKDVTMAQDANVTDIYAKYGLAQHRDAYELLRRVTHWTKEDVERERLILARGEVRATYILERSFSQILDLFDFVPYQM